MELQRMGGHDSNVTEEPQRDTSLTRIRHAVMHVDVYFWCAQFSLECTQSCVMAREESHCSGKIRISIHIDARQVFLSIVVSLAEFLHSYLHKNEHDATNFLRWKIKSWLKIWGRMIPKWILVWECKIKSPLEIGTMEPGKNQTDLGLHHRNIGAGRIPDHGLHHRNIGAGRKPDHGSHYSNTELMQAIHYKFHKFYFKIWSKVEFPNEGDISRNSH